MIPVERDRLWRSTSRPRPIDLAAARSNVVIVVVDDVMRGRPLEWENYLAATAAEIERRGGADLLLPVVTWPGPSLAVLDRRGLQAINAPTPEGTDGDWGRWLRRVTMCVMGVVWAHQRTHRGPGAKATDEAQRKITVFLSHAKMDSEGAA
jgi:hypothetical protein